MKFCRSFLLFGAASVLLGQTPPSTPPPAPQAPPTPQVHLSVENPEIKAPEVPPDRVVITVGDIKITAAEFNAFIDGLPAQYQKMAHGNGRRQLAENIVKTLTLAEEAQKRKLDQTNQFKVQELFQHYNLMANALATETNKDLQISEADVRQYYEAHKNEFETVHAKHILIRFQGSQVPVKAGQKDLTDAEALAKAQDIRKQIQDGADFATIAKAESDDAGSGANGGELPPFRHGQMVPTFEKAAFALKPGELSEPVKSQFGYHIILVVSHDTKPFEEVHAELENRMKPEQSQKAVNNLIAELEKANPAVLDPEFFPPPAPAHPIPMPPPTLKPPDKK
ncbi:MAG TPA: peptidylprolyl isomerase [Bryobacteraceae bacterium]|nr:peptidylprolyl isomerase [Bryobacteraceae bacterium]